MKQENVDRDGGGANVRADGVDQRGVERRSVQQKQKRRHGDGRHHPWPLVEQREDHHRHAQAHADRGDEVVRTLHPRQQLVAEPASDQRCQNAIDHDDLAEDQVRRFQTVAAGARQESRHPHLYSAQRKRPGGHAQRDHPESRVARQAAQCSPLRGFFQRVELASRRLRKESDCQRQQKAGKGRDVERKAPSVFRPQPAAQQIACRRAARNRQIENSENAAAFIFWKKVGDKSRSDGHERRLAHSHQRVAEQQLTVGVGDRGHQSQPAPEHCAQDDDQLARIAVRQRADKRRGHHVEQQESAGEISNLCVGEVEFGLHQRLHREQHGAVNVVEEVQRGQQDQRGPGIEFALGHLGRNITCSRFSPLSLSS